MADPQKQKPKSISQRITELFLNKPMPGGIETNSLSQANDALRQAVLTATQRDKKKKRQQQ